MRYLLVLTFLALTLTHPVKASETALSLYLRGAYDEAASRAINGPWQGDPQPDYALAARSMMAKVYYLPDIESRSTEQRMADLKKGQHWAELSVKEQPDVSEGYLQLVAALGHEGLHDGALIVFFSGIIGKSRQLLDQALQIDPDDPWVHGLIGGWHLELVRNAGKAFARDNKASMEEGIAAYEKALFLAPDNGMIRTEYALSLLLIDDAEHKQKAVKILQPLQDVEETSQTGRIARLRGLQVLALLQSDDRTALRAFLERIDRLRAVE